MNRLVGKAVAAVKVATMMAVVSGVLTSAAMVGKALHRSYAEAYGGGASVAARPSGAPTARTLAQTVPSVVRRGGDVAYDVPRGVPDGRGDIVTTAPTYRERRVTRALETWRSARSYERMNAYGLNAGDSERVDAAARELEDATR